MLAFMQRSRLFVWNDTKSCWRISLCSASAVHFVSSQQLLSSLCISSCESGSACQCFWPLTHPLDRHRLWEDGSSPWLDPGSVRWTPVWLVPAFWSLLDWNQVDIPNHWIFSSQGRRILWRWQLLELKSNYRDKLLSDVNSAAGFLHLVRCSSWRNRPLHLKLASHCQLGCSTWK